MKTISVAEAKIKAMRVRETVQRFDAKLSHAQALEVVATVYGDASWAAMRSRLALSAKAQADAPEPALLSFFTVWLYLGHEDGARTLVQSVSVLCYEGEQARAHAFEHYYPPQADQAGYCAQYETDALGPVDDEMLPDLHALADWLCEQMAGRSKHGDWACTDLETFLGLERGAVSAESCDAEIMLTRLRASALAFQDAQCWLRSLYAALPSGAYFSTTEPDPSGYVDELLKFAG